MAKDYQDPDNPDSAQLLSDKKLDARGMRIAVIVSRFNSLITGRLLKGALEELSNLGAERSDITVTEVPGAFELPQAANILLQNGKYDAIICLGCVIRGETSHYDYICQSCAMGLETLSMDTGIPIIFGVLTTENIEQAEARCGGAHGHKGFFSARAAVEMAMLVAEQKSTIPTTVQQRLAPKKAGSLSNAS